MILLYFCPFSVGHCMVYPSIYDFSMLAIVWSFLRSTTSQCWPLNDLSFDLRLLNVDHFMVYSSIYDFWMLAIVWSILQFTTSQCWPLYGLSFVLRLLNVIFKPLLTNEANKKSMQILPIQWLIRFLVGFVLLDL